MLLLSYPSIESFTLSNFMNDSFEMGFEIGKELKRYLHDLKINQSNINEKTLLFAVYEMMKALDRMSIYDFNVDTFGKYNDMIFSFEETEYEKNGVYRVLSLVCVSLIDLGIVEIVKK